MQKYCCAALGLALVTGAVRADEKTLLERAIQAAGGEANLAKFKAATWKSKGKFYGLGDVVDYHGAFAVQWPARTREVLDLEAGAQKIKYVIVFNRDKGWTQTNGLTDELDKDKLVEQQEEVYSSWLTTLLPLRDKAFTLTPLAEVQVDGRPAAGIKVAHKGHRDVELYFDRQTNLLVRADNRVKEEGKEIRQETFYLDYKDFSGLKQPTKMKIYRDGKLFLEGEDADFKLADQLDDKLFAKP